MSGVYIKGMKMPKSCLICPFGDEFGKCCVNAELEDANELTHSCPLVAVETREDALKILAEVQDEMRWMDGNGN